MTTENMESTPVAVDPAATPEPATPPAAPAAEPAVAPEVESKKEEVNAEPQKEPEWEAYEITPPEGVEVDKAQLADFTTFANELKIPKDKAEAFSHAFAKKQLEAVQNQIADWRTQAEADKELGGANYEQNVGIAKKALEKFGGDAVLDVLNKTGLGNHPEIIRWAYRVGKAMSDDVVLTQTGGTPKAEPTFVSALAAIANSNK